MALSLNWIKCQPNASWCPLLDLNLTAVNTTGVYIIWHEGNPSRTVRVGQGDIADRLGKHRSDAKITAYQQFGTLRVTWAAVPEGQMNGVERYLADLLNPLVGDAFPDVQPIAVNSPW